MFREPALALLLLLTAGCEESQKAAQEARLLAHFKQHREAFARLGEQLDRDVTVKEAQYCPPNTCGEPIPISYLSEEELARREAEYQAVAQVYDPLLADLGFKGVVWFRRWGDGFFWFPSMGSYSYADKEASLSLLYVPEGVEPPDQCDEYEDVNMCEVTIVTCYDPVENGWYLQWERTTTTNCKFDVE